MIGYPNIRDILFSYFVFRMFFSSFVMSVVFFVLFLKLFSGFCEDFIFLFVFNVYKNNSFLDKRAKKNECA